MSASNTDPAADDPVSDDNVSDVPRLEYPPQGDTDGDGDEDGDGDGDEAGAGDKAGDGDGDEDVPDETSAPSAPSASAEPSAAAEASAQQDTQVDSATSVLDGLPIEAVHPLYRVLIVAISGTLPTPADKWEMSIWERLIRKNMLTIGQGSEKPGFSLNHEGLKCEFIYDIRGDAMLMRTWGEFDAEIRALSGIVEQRKPWKKGNENLVALHPGSFRFIWKARGQSQAAGELELRLLTPRYRIKKYHVRQGISQREVRLSQDPRLPCAILTSSSTAGDPKGSTPSHLAQSTTWSRRQAS